jgi:hypothetical protein
MGRNVFGLNMTVITFASASGTVAAQVTTRSPDAAVSLIAVALRGRQDSCR